MADLDRAVRSSLKIDEVYRHLVEEVPKVADVDNIAVATANSDANTLCNEFKWDRRKPAVATGETRRAEGTSAGDSSTDLDAGVSNVAGIVDSSLHSVEVYNRVTRDMDLGSDSSPPRTFLGFTSGMVAMFAAMAVARLDLSWGTAAQQRPAP